MSDHPRLQRSVQSGRDEREPARRTALRPVAVLALMSMLLSAAAMAGGKGSVSPTKGRPARGPTARLTTTQAASPPRTVNADGSGSTAGDSPIASYGFDFGDGTSPVTKTAPTATAQHTYAQGGTYTVSLVVTDTNGRTANASSTITIGSPAGPIAVSVGYYDTHHSDVPRTKPSPWYGSSGIQFVGTPDSKTGGWDSSGIRIDNLTSGSISVTVTVDMGSSHFSLWGSRTIAANGTLVLAQTGYENFDGSDTNPAGCYGCDPKLCTTQVQSTVPVVHVTTNGTTTNYYDSGQISNTHGVDMAGCPYTGTRNDESQVWTPIYAQAPAAMRTSDGRARTEADTPMAPVRQLYFGPVFPNPAGTHLTLRYVIPTREDVEIAVYDVSGRRVQSHLNEDLDPGEYQSVMDISGFASGMYLCRLQAGDHVLQQRFVHIR